MSKVISLIETNGIRSEAFMNIILRPETERLLEEQLKKTGYQSVDELVRAGITSLEIHGDFAPGELDRLLAEGEADLAAGHVVDGEQVFRELDQMSASRREKLT